MKFQKESRNEHLYWSCLNCKFIERRIIINKTILQCSISSPANLLTTWVDSGTNIVEGAFEGIPVQIPGGLIKKTFCGNPEENSERNPKLWCNPGGYSKLWMKHKKEHQYYPVKKLLEKPWNSFLKKTRKERNPRKKILKESWNLKFHVPYNF